MCPAWLPYRQIPPGLLSLLSCISLCKLWILFKSFQLTTKLVTCKLSAVNFLKDFSKRQVAFRMTPLQWTASLSVTQVNFLGQQGTPCGNATWCLFKWRQLPISDKQLGCACFFILVGIMIIIASINCPRIFRVADAFQAVTEPS